MIDTGIKQAVLDEIATLAKVHGIEKVILFGSRAWGDFREKSDIDLAVTGGNFSAFKTAVDEETSTLLCYDVVNLATATDPDLLRDINRDGIVLYNTPS